jgi:hypothetical protein
MAASPDMTGPPNRQGDRGVGAHRGRGELIAFATFVTGHWTLSAKHVNAAQSDPGMLHGVLAAGLYLAVIILVGLGLGAGDPAHHRAIAALFPWCSSSRRSSTQCPRPGAPASANTGSTTPGERPLRASDGCCVPNPAHRVGVDAVGLMRSS